MTDATRRLAYRGFDLRLEHDLKEDEARRLVDEALSRSGDRVAFVLDRPGGTPDADGKPERFFVKAEFRRPHQPLTARFRPGRAVSEGRGYRRILEAGLPAPRLLLFGEQPRWYPRGCALVVTRKLRGLDAARRWMRKGELAIPLEAARLLARVHAAGFVHGDAVLRNFLSSGGAMHVIDLPRWGPWSTRNAIRDLSRLVTSTHKRRPLPREGEELLEAYAAEKSGAADRLPSDWRDRVRAEAARYLAYLLDKDATRPERHARKKKRLLPGERRPR